MLTTQFIMGLKEELKLPVEMQLLDSVAKAVVLASIQENLLDKGQKRQYRSFSAKQWLTTSKPDQKTSFIPGDLWKARQLREHRRTHGLCFKCGDKFAPSHKCPDVTSAAYLAQLTTIDQSADGGGLMSDEILEILEASSEQHTSDGFLSLNAIIGTQNNMVIHLGALVQNQVLSILIDSGSSHSFLNSSMVDKAQCALTPTNYMKVKVANGQTILSSHSVKAFSWWIQGHTFHMDVRVLDLAAYDLILGMD
jgi:hypothetical protein